MSKEAFHTVKHHQASLIPPVDWVESLRFFVHPRQLTEGVTALGDMEGSLPVRDSWNPSVRFATCGATVFTAKLSPFRDPKRWPPPCGLLNVPSLPRWTRWAGKLGSTGSFPLKKIPGKIFWNFNHRTAKVDMAMNCVDLSAGGPKKKRVVVVDTLELAVWWKTPRNQDELSKIRDYQLLDTVRLFVSIFFSVFAPLVW